jgi:HAE1 family hydrophobic/amphiphilic exporter-1/multidrug efflux pump
MVSRFFIDRPIFAAVIAIIIMLAGGLAIVNLPVEQYPNIGLPQVNVSANYPGANAQVIEDSVTQVIEQGMTGLDHLKYITSQSSSGRANVTLVFDAGTDPDKAQIQVQNQVQAIARLLPQDVQTQGVRVNKSNNSSLMNIALYSPNDRYTNFELAD